MRRAILLSGGAAFGALQVPILEALHGVGPGELRDLWLEVGEAKGASWFQRPNVDVWKGLFTLAPLRRQMVKRGVGRSLGQDEAPDVRVGVTNLANMQHGLIRLNSHQWKDRIRASICSSTQGGIHEGNRFLGKLRHDGGHTHVLPTLPDWEDYDEIHAVFCSPVGDARDRPRKRQDEIDGLLEALFCHLDASIDRIAQDDWKRALSWPNCTIYAPRSWEAVGESMKAEPEDIEARLVEGLRMFENPVRQAPCSGDTGVADAYCGTSVGSLHAMMAGEGRV